MNVGIELLIKRIKDCPDEFVGGDWNRLIGFRGISCGRYPGTRMQKSCWDACMPGNMILINLLKYSRSPSTTIRHMKTHMLPCWIPITGPVGTERPWACDQ